MMEEKASFIHSYARLEEDGWAVLGGKTARLCDRDGSICSILYIPVSQHSMVLYISSQKTFHILFYG